MSASDDRFGERALAGLLRELGLVGVHQLGAALVDQPGEVGNPDVLARQPELDEQAQTRERRGAGARCDQLDLPDVLADHLQPVDQRSADDDRGAVLIVVEDRNLHALAQRTLDVKAVRGLDVFEVDAAEGGLERGDQVDQLVEVLFAHLDVEHVDAGELLEQHPLAFHHRLRGQRPDVAEPEHRGPVGDHGDQVAARREAKRIRRIGSDLFAGGGDAGRIGERQIALVDHLFGGTDRDLAGRRKLVVLERLAPQFGVFLFVSGHRGSRAC